MDQSSTNTSTLFATGRPIFLKYTNGGVLPTPAKSLGINVDQIITINYNFRYTYTGGSIFLEYTHGSVFACTCKVPRHPCGSNNNDQLEFRTFLSNVKITGLDFGEGGKYIFIADD